MTKPLDIGTCADCAAWEAAGALSGAPAGAGFCHLNPPDVFMVAGPQGPTQMSLFKPVPGGAWCMAWSANDAPNGGTTPQ